MQMPSLTVNLELILSDCVYDSDVGVRWVPMISMELVTLSDRKHQRKKSQIQTESLCVKAPLQLKFGTLIISRYSTRNIRHFALTL